MATNKLVGVETFIVTELLINDSFGGFKLSKKVWDQVPHLDYLKRDSLEVRTDKQLTELFKRDRSIFRKVLQLAQIYTSSSQSDYPMPLTEWFEFEIEEYDGLEKVVVRPVDPRMKYVSQIISSAEKSDSKKVEETHLLCKLITPTFDVNYI